MILIKKEHLKYLPTSKIIFLLVGLFFSFNAYSENIEIIFTADTYASLYPCGHCDSSVGGGVTRRATVIKEEKTKNKNVILVDGGNFTAGQPWEDTKANANLDKQMSLTYYKIMQAMGYDAVGIGQGEFNFGEKFFKEVLTRLSLPLVSSNMRCEGVSQFIVKKLGDIKVAVIGLTSVDISKKYSIEIEDYELALKDVIRKVNQDVQLIILTSTLSDQYTISLVKKFPEINIVLLSGDLTSYVVSEKIGETLFIRPSFEGKSLRLINLDLDKKKIKKYEVIERKLPMIIKEDLKIKAILPVCFSDENCPRKDRMIGVCQNPGDKKAVCAYFEAQKMEGIILTDTKCKFCSVDMPSKLLKNTFPGLEFKIVDYNSKEGTKLIKDYDVKTLPVFLLPLIIKDSREFIQDQIGNIVQEKRDYLFLKTEISGVFLYLDRQKMPKRIDYSLDLFKPAAGKILKDLYSFCKTNNINLGVNIVTSKEKVKGYPKDEVLIALAVKALYPEKFIDYLMLRLDYIDSIFWMKPLEILGLDDKKVLKLIESQDMEKFIETNSRFFSSLNINDGNVILVNNQYIFQIFQFNAEELKLLF